MSPFVFPIPEIDWTQLVPVLAVSIGGILALIWQLVHRGRSNAGILGVCVVSLAITMGYLGAQMMREVPSVETFGNMVFTDAFGLSMQFLLALSCLLILFFSEDYLHEKGISFAEFYPLAMWATAGAMIMASTKSLLMVFVGLEILSISLYALAGLSKYETRSQESSIKYFLLGAFASAFLLYGIAFIYGATGSIHLDSIYVAAGSANDVVRVPLTFGIALMFVGLLFKAALAPFHQWTPDVYQGAPTNVTALLATVSKIAAVAFLFRVMDVVSPMAHIWVPLLSGVAVLTMVLGNVQALVQTDVKRIMGYSSISNAGYLLVALIARMQNPERITPLAITIFLAGYVVMTLGSFGVFTLLTRNGKEFTDLKDLRGLFQTHPFAAAALAVFLCSQIGVPIFAGFWGKLMIFSDALGVGLNALAIIMAITSVISAFYYLVIIRAAFVDKSEVAPGTPALAPMRGGLKLVTWVCLVGTVLAFLAISPLSKYYESNNSFVKAPAAVEVAQR